MSIWPVELPRELQAKDLIFLKNIIMDFKSHYIGPI